VNQKIQKQYASSLMIHFNPRHIMKKFEFISFQLTSPRNQFDIRRPFHYLHSFTMAAASSSSTEESPDDTSFLSCLTGKEVTDLKLELDAFIVQHATHHRPIAVVTSGGTAADLEVHSVRCLDNFSTGLRGAVSVEEFLARGYAVVHLWRRGSASPFARVLSQHLGIESANHGLNVESLGRLFAIEGEDDDDELVKTVLEKERDPWLTDSTPEAVTFEEVKRPAKDVVSLNRGLVYSSRVHKALRERSSALQEGRLLTIPFRTVEEYIAKLQICAEGLDVCQSLTIFYLAAAVSDFYVPRSERSEHKIQGKDNSGEEGLVLKLKPVPKILGTLRKKWAPSAFVVSFKLETDPDLLRTKAERAVERYGCHMVIGNLLQSRHEKVFILTPEDQQVQNPCDATDWPLEEITKSSNDIDSLESSLMDVVIQVRTCAVVQ
jgi:phosphopantothenate-cysteine ligase